MRLLVSNFSLSEEYIQGWDAYYWEGDSAKCPYSYPSISRTEWMEGFKDSKENFHSNS